ncbi:MAG: hypothetical protein IJG87_00935 [Ruminococcus sp.]|nr:hypothetical protein [Ruminococcus sp.]
MKRVLSIVSVIMALCVLLSCTAVVVTAVPAQEPQQPEYIRYPVTMIMAGMPKSIKAQFDYDRDYIDIAPDYPSFNGTGFVFPLAGGEYDSMYDVSYTVNDTLITYTYTLKDGYTLSDYLDMLDAINESNGAAPVSRENGARHVFRLFDIATKINNPAFWDYLAKVADQKMLEVVTTDGKSLDVTTNAQNSEVYCHIDMVYLPDPDAPTEPTEEVKEYKYKDKLLSQYHISEYSLLEYDEFYEHTDESGAVDWALVKAETEGQSSPGWTSPAYYEFGNRVLDINDRYEPFAFGMGVYSVKHDRFFDVSSPELYELDGLERVWTEIGAGRLMGDMDGNNRLEVIDALLIQRCQAGIMDYPDSDRNIPSDMVENPIGYYSDFNQDGERNILDATVIQRYLANLQYRPAGWTPYPHNAWPEPEPPTEPQPTEPGKLSTPQITGFKSTAEGVEIHIGAVEGGEKYRVYYRNKNGNWVKMGETSTGVFVDTDVKTGSSYRYTVRCIKADLSDFTSDFNTDGWSYTYYPTPKITKCEAVSDGIEITWNPVKGAEKYRVYYKGSKGWTKMADVSGTSYVDTDVSAKHWYTYTVRCVSSDGTQFMSDYDANGTRIYLAEPPVIDHFNTRMDGIDIVVDAIKSIARVYRKTSDGWKRIAELDTQDGCVFRDTDVEPGKTYTYTVRKVDEDGNFVSWYNTSGWSYTYKKSDCQPELEYFVYNGDNTAFVNLKSDNKFGIKQFYIHVIIDGDYKGTFQVPDMPAQLQADFFKPNQEYLLYIAGIDSSGNEITQEGEQWISTPARPTNIKTETIDNRRYSLTWSSTYSAPYLYDVNIISQDGKYAIDSDVIAKREFTFDLSDYPENTEWIIYVYVINDDRVSLSCGNIEFKES